MPITVFTNFTEKDKASAVDRLILGSTPSQDFFLMVVLSAFTAVFGLIANSAEIILGSMLIAPLLYPILSFSLGLTMSDTSVISRSFWTLLKSLVLAVVASFLIALLFSNEYSEITPEIASRTAPSLVYLMVAIVSGFAASFALVKPHLNETLPGVSISVALLPPVAVIGIGLARLDLSMISGAFLLFLVNAIGIIFASMITFSLMKFYSQKGEAHREIKKAEREIASDKLKAQKHR